MISQLIKIFQFLWVWRDSIKDALAYEDGVITAYYYVKYLRGQTNFLKIMSDHRLLFQKWCVVTIINQRQVDGVGGHGTSLATMWSIHAWWLVTTWAIHAGSLIVRVWPTSCMTEKGMSLFGRTQFYPRLVMPDIWPYPLQPWPFLTIPFSLSHACLDPVFYFVHHLLKIFVQHTKTLIYWEDIQIRKADLKHMRSVRTSSSLLPNPRRASPQWWANN